MPALYAATPSPTAPKTTTTTSRTRAIVRGFTVGRAPCSLGPAGRSGGSLMGLIVVVDCGADVSSGRRDDGGALLRPHVVRTLRDEVIHATAVAGVADSPIEAGQGRLA